MFPYFLAFLVGNCETEPHHDIDSKNLEWGFHIDMNSIFADFFILVNFKFPDHIKIYWLFPDFLRCSFFPSFFLTCGNPESFWIFLTKSKFFEIYN